MSKIRPLAERYGFHKNLISRSSGSGAKTQTISVPFNIIDLWEDDGSLKTGVQVVKIPDYGHYALLVIPDGSPLLSAPQYLDPIIRRLHEDLSQAYEQSELVLANEHAMKDPSKDALLFAEVVMPHGKELIPLPHDVIGIPKSELARLRKNYLDKVSKENPKKKGRRKTA